jgi:N12 class adenine-specific DNA methylase
MSALSKLKLVAAHAEKKSPMVLRRAKLTGKLQDQIAAAKAATTGDTYASKRVKFVQDSESGERKAVEIATRVKQWWWRAANGKINVAIRYGAKQIEIAPKKNAIEVGSMDELVAALGAVKDAVHAGELDAQIEQASGSLRAGFAKKK